MYAQELRAFTAMWTVGELQIVLARADEMQVGADECRFICS